MPILLIAASPSANSRSAQLLGAAGERLQHLGQRTQTLRLRELPAQPLLLGDAQHPGLLDAQRSLAQADAVVIATPIYKAAYSGLLKVFLDLLPQRALVGKPVWTLATGGSQAHQLALDYALAPVLAALGARCQAAPVYATDAELGPGSLTPGNGGSGAHAADWPEPLRRRLNDGADQLLSLLPERAEALA